jgi:16S rRNA (cytidine1402-2'-O)-methyltransferase
MKPNSSLGKLYSNHYGWLRSYGCFTTNRKRTIDFIDHYIVENDKTARKSIKEVNRKKQSELVLFTLNKRTEVKEHLDFKTLTGR